MSTTPLSSAAKKNIEAIAQVEQELHGRRSRVEKTGDSIARFFGSLWFITAHVVFLTVWIFLNIQSLHDLPAFGCWQTRNKQSQPQKRRRGAKTKKPLDLQQSSGLIVH